MLIQLNRMFLVAVLVIGLSQSLPAQQALQEKAPIDEFPKVVAVVNGKTISREQLADDCLLRFGPIVLDNLLNKHLILQACEAKGVKVTQADVNAEIEKTAAKFGLTTKLFLEAMQKERDITPEQYASEIVWPMLALRVLAKEKIQVSDEEIEQTIQSEYGPKVQVRMIALSDLQKAQQLHAEATQAPELFRKLAKQHSEDAASASVEGLLPPIKRYGGDDELEKFAFQLQPNQISPVFKIGELNIFLQCVRHLPATPPSPQYLPAIRQRIRDTLSDQRLGRAADEIFGALQQQSQIVRVVGDANLEKQYPQVAGFINRQPVPRDHLAAECIARHGKDILKGEISRLLLRDALKQSGKVIGQPDLMAEVARAAEAMGYIRQDGSADIEGWLQSVESEEGVTRDLYIKDAVWPSVALKKLVEENVAVTEQDLREGFVANYGPRAEVLAIVLTNQRTAEQVFREARSATEQMFGELAAKYSVEPISRSNFGKVPPLRRSGGQPTLEKAAFDLQPGEVSGVIALKDQFAILYKQGETEPLVTDFEAAREELSRDLLEKKMRIAMQDKLDDLIGAAQIENLLDGSFSTPPPRAANTGNAAALR